MAERVPCDASGSDFRPDALSHFSSGRHCVPAPIEEESSCSTSAGDTPSARSSISSTEARFPVPPRRRNHASAHLQPWEARSLPGKISEKMFEAEAEKNDYSGTEPESEPTLSQWRAASQKFAKAGGCTISSFTMGQPKHKRMPIVVPGATPMGIVDRVKYQFNAFVRWCAQLERQYGRPLLLLLFSSQHLLRGVVMRFQSAAVMWVLMEYRVDGPQMQIYMSIANSSWALKPIIGAISDMYPVMGYRKAPYVVITSVIGVMCTAAIGFSTREATGVFFVVACLFGTTLQASTCDLLTEAKYSEQLQENPTYGPDLITFVWGGVSVGNLVAITVVGTIITYCGPRAVFLACIVPSAAILWPTANNYFEERPLSREGALQVRDAFMRQREVVFLCVLMTFLTVLLTAVGFFSDSHTVHLMTAVLVLVVLVPSFYLVLRPEIARINAFFVLQAALSLNIGGATFYFYTDGPEQYPEGPHFSPSFFASTLGIVASLMSVVGLTVYLQHMKEWSYRSLFMFSNVLATVLSLLDVTIFLRANLSLGIPDSIFVLGSSAFSVVIKQWQWMPGVVILSQLCPVGMEATMFALLAGCANIGSQVGDYLGAGLLAGLGIQPSGALQEGGQFVNLWKASCVATILPALTIALIPLLIPQAKQTERLLLNDVSSATAGSLLSEWRKGRDSTR